MKSAALSVAVAQPVIVSNALEVNARAHARTIRAAAARLVVFPELSLTGYELDAPAVDLHDPVLEIIAAACRETNTVALVGAPVREAGRDYIAVLRIDESGVSIATRKSWLHDGESVRFAPGDGARSVDVDGWRVGIAICKDTNMLEHTDQLAHQGVDLYVAGVLDTPGEADYRAERSVRTARALRVPVAIANYVGATTLYPDATGTSMIYGADGAVLMAVAGTAETAVASVRG